MDDKTINAMAKMWAHRERHPSDKAYEKFVSPFDETGDISTLDVQDFFRAGWDAAVALKTQNETNKP